ncbi:MAG: hypothetical protein HYY03_05390 [Chloroflexi bacterium]|nr:hypothetical protein [Chloroflexota bacterium]
MRGYLYLALLMLPGCLALASTACRDGSPGGAGVSQAEQQALELAADAARSEGVLEGDPSDISAERMSLAEAERRLVEWGATLAQIANYPPPETAVWLVVIRGRGYQPGPPPFQPKLECLEVRVIILEDPPRDLALFGRPVEEC